MNRKIIFAITILLALSVSPGYSAETELVSDKTLRITVAPSFGFQAQEWDGMEVGKVMAFSTGLGFEYGINNWFAVQALWLPGFNAWSYYDAGKYGYFSDSFFGLKAGILGGQGLIANRVFRVAVAAGLDLPLPSWHDSEREGDKHLWGSVFQVYYDILCYPVFYLNFFAEIAYYPEQRVIGPNYETRSVDHPLEITFELEPRFKHEVGRGITLHWGIPLNFFVAPFVNQNDDDAPGPQISFNPGMFFTAAFADFKVPFDISLSYVAPAAGKNIEPVHRVSLLGRIYVNF